MPNPAGRKNRGNKQEKHQREGSFLIPEKKKTEGEKFGGGNGIHYSKKGKVESQGKENTEKRVLPLEKSREGGAIALKAIAGNQNPLWECHFGEKRGMTHDRKERKKSRGLPIPGRGRRTSADIALKYFLSIITEKGQLDTPKVGQPLGGGKDREKGRSRQPCKNHA